MSKLLGRRRRFERRDRAQRALERRQRGGVLRGDELRDSEQVRAQGTRLRREQLFDRARGIGCRAQVCVLGAPERPRERSLRQVVRPWLHGAHCSCARAPATWPCHRRS
jgi:hypothetical protein